ncbi:MAG: hypothetical protein AAF542_06465 [Pseudomonadota bacterium]
MVDEAVLDEIRRCNRLPREHAGFFNWHEKEIKEAGVTDIFLDPRNHEGQHSFETFNVNPNDPPDIWLFDGNGDKTGLEITELVNSQAIDAQIHGLSNYWSECERWANKEYFEEKINEQVSQKSDKCRDLVSEALNFELLFHCDELWVEKCCDAFLSEGVNMNPHVFGRVWLLLSYSPHLKRCKLIKLGETYNDGFKQTPKSGAA